jgi:hypothetical protein
MAAIPAMALDNAVSVYSMSGGDQPNRVVALARFFAEGEIPGGCVTAYASGNPLTSQTDPRTYWPDNSLKHALVSFEAPVSTVGLKVEFRDSTNCNNSGQISYAQLATGGSLAWGAQLETTASGVTQARSAQAMLDACGSISTDPFSSMCRYWRRGPLVTEVVIEDRSTLRGLDFGFQYSGSTWQAATTAAYKSLHPVFVVAVYTPSTGGPFVSVQTILENTWADRIQRQAYTINLKTGSSLSTVYSRTTEWSHVARSRWRIDRWSGTIPGEIFIDHNLSYLIYSKAVPQYDTATEISATAANGFINSYTTNIGTEEPPFCPTANIFCGNILKSMPGTGGRADIALIPGWFTMYLKSMSNPNVPLIKRKEIYDKLLIGNALAASGAGIDYREFLTDRCADESGATKFSSSSGCAQNAFGLPMSVNARPTLLTWPPSNYETSHIDVAASDRLPAWLCSAGECSSVTGNNWVAGSDLSKAHTPGVSYIPYLVTGDMYFLDELQFWAASHLLTAFPNTLDWQRHGTWAFLNFYNNDRYWVLRDLGHAALITPDGHPLKNYFLQKFKKNMAVEEGSYNMTNGLNYDPNSSSAWFWGRNTIGKGSPNPLGLKNRVGSASSAGCSPCDGWDITKGYSGDRRYYLSYRNIIYGHLAEVLPEAVPVAEFLQRGLVTMIVSDGRLAYQNAAYNWPYQQTATTWFTTTSSLIDAMSLDCTLHADITSTTATSFQCRVPQTAMLATGADVLFQIDSERIRVCGVPASSTSGGNLVYTFTVGTSVTCSGGSAAARGFQGTVAATHLAGATATRIFSFFFPDGDTTGSYVYALRGSLAFAAKDSIPNSGRAWDWMLQNTPNAGFLAGNAMWNFVPREQIRAVTVNPGSSGAVVRFNAPSSGSVCSGVVGLSRPSSTLTGSDQTIASNSAIREWVLTGLLASSQYYGRLTCGTARSSFQFVTGAAGGLVPLQEKFGLPPAGASKMLVEVSSNSSMSSAVSSQSACASGCAITIANLTAGGIYYERHTWLDGSNNPVAASRPAPFIAK